ncbi:MAG: hypothetical protein KGQ58_08255 [Proteobacteria bacterium]|nr:hypothetical protein [Pseudomonadota bacterium]MDE3208649.1 hypothetical protein [Pseudomonadota bacterium]
MKDNGNDNYFLNTELSINSYRHMLSDTSPLAHAIDRNDSWPRLAKLALRLGHTHFAELLIHASEKITP